MSRLDEHGKVSAGLETLRLQLFQFSKVEFVHMANILFHMLAVEETLVRFVQQLAEVLQRLGS